MTLRGEQKIQVLAGVSARENHGEIRLENEATRATVDLDPVGVETWRLIKSAHSVSTIRQTIYDRFDTDIDTVCRDLDALVTTLVEHGMVRVVG